MKNLKWKEIFEKCNHNKYCQITNVLQKYSISSNVKYLLKNYGKVLLVIIIVFLLLLIYTFRNDLLIVLYASLLCFLLFLMTVFYSTYKISLEEDKLIARINMQDNIITYDKLNNIYLQRQRTKLLFIPFYTYVLKVSYFIEDKKLNILSFPVVMLDKKSLINFFNSFEVKAYKDQDEETAKETQDRKNFYKSISIVIGILFIIIFIISIILYIIR